MIENEYPSIREVYKGSNTINLTDYNDQQNHIMNIKKENPQLTSTQTSFKEKNSLISGKYLSQYPNVYENDLVKRLSNPQLTLASPKKLHEPEFHT